MAAYGNGIKGLVMGRRSEHSREEQQSMALAAVRKIIRKKGYRGVSTRAIAREMGYTVGTIYHIFRNLDHVISEVNLQTVRDIRRLMDENTATAATPEEHLRAMARSYLEYAIAHPNLWRLSIEHTMDDNEDYRLPALAQTEAIFSEAAETLAQLAPGRTQEELQIAAAALWSGVHGVCHLALTDKLTLAAPDSAGRILDLQLDAFIGGFKAT